jgi:hypothetical protein
MAAAFKNYVNKLLNDLPNVGPGKSPPNEVLRHITSVDAVAVEKLLRLLLVDVGARVGEMLSNEKNYVTISPGLPDALNRQLIEHDLTPIRDQLSSSIGEVVKDLFTDSLPYLADDSIKPIKDLAGVSWRRADSELLALGAIISRLERDLDTLAGLETAFFVELSEMLASMLSLEIKLTTYSSRFGNRDFELASQKLTDNEHRDIDKHYKEAIDRYGTALPGHRDDAHYTTYDTLLAQRSQATIGQQNHAIEMGLTQTQLHYAIAEGIVGRANATLGEAVLEERLMVQLNKMLSSGFFPRRDALRRRIAQDILELQLRIEGIKQGLDWIFLLPRSSYGPDPLTVRSVRQWIGTLRRIDAYINRQLSTELPIRLRPSFVTEGVKLLDIVTGSPANIDLEPFLRLACGNVGRLRLRGIGAQIEAGGKSVWGGTLHIKPPENMNYSSLEKPAQPYQEDLPSLPFTMLRTPDLPQSDVVVTVDPWSNISGLGKWQIWVDKDSRLAGGVKDGTIKDFNLILDFAWLRG